MREHHTLPVNIQETSIAARATQDCICFNLRKTARLVSQHYDRALKSFGLNSGQFAILSLLGAIPDHMALTEVAKNLGMERTTLTRNLHLLEKAGLSKTLIDGKDARARRLALTTKGWAVLADALPTWETVQMQTLAHLDGQDWPVLQQSLKALGQGNA